MGSQDRGLSALHSGGDNSYTIGILLGKYDGKTGCDYKSLFFWNDFSTHLLTVLTNGDIIQSEQGNREKNRSIAQENI